MAAVLRSGVRRVAGSALVEGAPAAGARIQGGSASGFSSLLQGATAAGARIKGGSASGLSAVIKGALPAGARIQVLPATGPLLQRATPAGTDGLLLQPFFPRLITTAAADSEKYTQMDKTEYEQLEKAFQELEDVNLVDSKVKKSFVLLAAVRGDCPLNLRRWDKFVHAAKMYFIPTNTAELRNVLFNGCWFGFLGLLVLYEVSSLTRKQLKTAGAKIATFLLPLLAFIFNLPSDGEEEKPDEENKSSDGEEKK